MDTFYTICDEARNQIEAIERRRETKLTKLACAKLKADLEYYGFEHSEQLRAHLFDIAKQAVGAIDEVHSFADVKHMYATIIRQLSWDENQGQIKIVALPDGCFDVYLEKDVGALPLAECPIVQATLGDPGAWPDLSKTVITSRRRYFGESPSCITLEGVEQFM